MSPPVVKIEQQPTSLLFSKVSEAGKNNVDSISVAYGT